MRLCNLRKAHCVRLWWENQEGARRTAKPELPTVFGREIDPHALAYRTLDATTAQDETMLERAQRRGILDTWQPVARVDFNSRVREVFQGEDAVRIWNAWKGIVYAKE